jgi:hypothetical protein
LPISWIESVLNQGHSPETGRGSQLVADMEEWRVLRLDDGDELTLAG